VLVVSNAFVALQAADSRRGSGGSLFFTPMPGSSPQSDAVAAAVDLAESISEFQASAEKGANR
jgi:hypothetical protein